MLFMPDEPSPPHNEKPSSLENLEHRLYSRTPPPLRHDEEYGLAEQHVRIAPGWAEEEERKKSALYGIFAKIMPWLKRLFIASILFFLFAAGVAIFSFWRGGTTVSPKNISLAVLGPVSAPAGEELSFEVTVTNYNALDLESADLLVKFPDGTRKSTDLSTEFLRYREDLGAVKAGQSISRKLSMVPFGEEGEKKKVEVTVEYRQKDSSAIFPQATVYEFLINAAPVTVELSAPKEVSSGETFEIGLEITSNSSSVIKNALVKADYPVGFTFTDSKPVASFSKNTWQLGDIEPKGRRILKVRGRIEASEEEERTIRFSVGTAHPKDEKQLGTVFLVETPTLLVQKSAVTLDLVINGTRGKEFIARSGQILRADILWQNNLPVKITDMEITAKLEGSIYDSSTISGSGGFYDSNTASILWDKRSQSTFGVVEPGEEGVSNFSFSTLSIATDPKFFKNPSMRIIVSAKGKRIDETGAYQTVVSSLSKEIRIASTMGLVTRLFHGIGAFANTGPLPPKAGEKTTYTVTWSLSNSSNGVSDVTVRAVLPSYVKWLDQVSPASERVTYSGVGGEVVWQVGEIASGVGLGTAPREVSFQIELLPSASQVGAAPTLVGETKAEGEDRFVNIRVESNARPALTTDSLSDGALEPGSGRVVGN